MYVSFKHDAYTLCVPNRVEAKGISVAYSVRGDIHNGKAKIIPDKEIWYAVGGKEYQSISIDFDGLNKDHDYEILNVKASNTKVIGKIWINSIWYDEDYIVSYDPDIDDIVETYVRNGKASASFLLRQRVLEVRISHMCLKIKKPDKSLLIRHQPLPLRKRRLISMPIIKRQKDIRKRMFY